MKQAAAYLEALENYSREHSGCVSCRLREPLSRHTTFRIGGPADFFLEPASPEALQFLLSEAHRCGVRTLVIGRGSNLLFDDSGFRGAVIATTSLRRVTCRGDRITAEAGASLHACAQAAMEASLSGMEFANGIPGSCGGAVFMNAGAYGGEMAQIVSSSRYYNTQTDTFGELAAAEHCFGYRDSVYRHRPELVVLSVSLLLHQGSRDEILGQMNDLMRRRAEKQPLDFPSAGSVFKRYPGRYTAQMIEEAGLKGYAIGGARVSEKHAGFIINQGGATAEDVRKLILHIQNEIQRRFGVDIQTEIVYVPEYGVNGN